MKVNKNVYPSALQIQDQYLNQNTQGAVKPAPQGASFQDILSKKVQGAEESELRFSKHANSRLADRNIRLTDEQMNRLGEGTQRAGAKGIRESLIMVDSLAFIVNIPSKTVVTAMDQEDTKSNIFTNIDGAVIA